MVFGFLMFDNISFWELFIIVFFVFIFFGPRSIPRLFNNLRSGLQHLKDAVQQINKDLHNS